MPAARSTRQGRRTRPRRWRCGGPVVWSRATTTRMPTSASPGPGPDRRCCSPPTRAGAWWAASWSAMTGTRAGSITSPWTRAAARGSGRGVAVPAGRAQGAAHGPPQQCQGGGVLRPPGLRGGGAGRHAALARPDVTAARRASSRTRPPSPAETAARRRLGAGPWHERRADAAGEAPALPAEESLPRRRSCVAAREQVPAPGERCRQRPDTREVPVARVEQGVALLQHCQSGHAQEGRAGQASPKARLATWSATSQPGRSLGANSSAGAFSRRSPRWAARTSPTTNPTNSAGRSSWQRPPYWLVPAQAVSVVVGKARPRASPRCSTAPRRSDQREQSTPPQAQGRPYGWRLLQRHDRRGGLVTVRSRLPSPLSDAAATDAAGAMIATDRAMSWGSLIPFDPVRLASMVDGMV